MKDIGKWAIVHTLHWAVLYGAFVAQLEGAMYMLKFWAWVMAVIALVLLSESAIQEAAKKPPQPLRRWMNMAQAWATLGLLVWHGHLATALAWGLVMAVVSIHHSAARKARTEAAAQAA